MTDRLADLSPYVYGTTRLGDEALAFADRVGVARAAMDAGVWFHTSHTYGNALEVLRTAFDEDRARVPKLIVKIGWSTFDELGEVIRQNIEPLGVEKIDIGQLCLGGALADAYRGGDLDGFHRLREEGLVERFVVEVFPWTSAVPLAALRAGHADDLIAAHILYLNPLQRFADNALWDELTAREAPIIAMRTVAGGDVHRLRDVPGAAWKSYLQRRAVEIAPIFERSGVATWCEFCVRYAHGRPNVRSTVGATSRVDRLSEFLSAAEGPIDALPADIMREIADLQRRWSAETDTTAEPWSM